MERDSITTSLEWENLAFSMPFLGNEFGSMGCSSEGLQPIIGLRAILPPFSTPVPSTPMKRSRASYHNMQNPCCQVEGCNLDLKMAKDYHRRHRICETHSKSPKVVVAGMERRFCQQCSRFHDLSEFDDMKRSCRRRLSDHNARRRRVQPESSSHLTSHSPALYDQRQQNVLLNGLPISLSNQRWGENAHTPISRNALIRPNPRILDPSSNNSLAPDLLNAHSLLSSGGWSLSDGESASMAGIGNYSSMIRHSELQPGPNRSKMFRTGEDQGPSHHHHHHQQEYQLFKEPYDCGTFYSTQRSL